MLSGGLTGRGGGESGLIVVCVRRGEVIKKVAPAKGENSQKAKISSGA